MLEQIRRSNLDALIKDRFEGNRAAFCRATGKHPNLINLILSKNPNLKRGIGEKLCRSIEETLSLPPGWLDTPTHGSEGAGSIVVSIIDNTRTDEWMTLDRASLREVSAATPSGHIAVVRVKSDHMMPTLSPGDLIFLDTSDTAKQIDQSGAMLLVDGPDGHSLVRFRKTAEAWVVAYDNPAYQPIKVSQAFINKQKIVGRAVSALTIKKV